MKSGAVSTAVRVDTSGAILTILVRRVTKTMMESKPKRERGRKGTPRPLESPRPVGMGKECGTPMGAWLKDLLA